VKKRWKVAIGCGVAAALFVLVPITYIEARCRGGADDGAARPYRSLAGMGRPEARTWLTYPEWHIVYAADALGAWLTAGKPPSGYPYLSDARAFWSSYCRLNKIVDGREGSGSARVMLHTIGVSFTAEMLVKSVYENTIGRLSEAIGGWASPADRHAARVQQDYGSFMHEVPWYAYPFGKALSQTWSMEGSGFRHFERQLALTLEYGVKAGYAKAIGGASNATLGPDETRMHIVLAAAPEQVKAVDARLVPVRKLGNGTLLVNTPRYAAFTKIAGKLADRGVPILEIAGNDDIFVTALTPAAARPIAGTKPVMIMALPDKRRRQGITVKVPDLTRLIRAVRAAGGEIEHVYDY
jgi:hypothetical protein